MSPEHLQRLSALLDEVLDLDVPQRAGWLDALERTDAELGVTLRNLLARDAAGETGDLLARGPCFAPPEARDFAAGERIGPYRLLRELGVGGMGEVWLAERVDGQLKRKVALKLPTLGARRAVLRQRFARERDILAGLEHPHIARLYDAGLADDGQPYLALEWVEGTQITEHAMARGLGLRERVELLVQVAEAVQFAHSRLVVHRDLKPSNVLVTEQGQVRLLDFGIAKMLAADETDAGSTELTQLGGRALTLAYAAPEQVRGEPISIATDVYALGALLHELLTGHVPFEGPRAEVEQGILTRPPQRPVGIPADLAQIALKALEKAPQDRYATAIALSEDLGRWLRGEAVSAQPPRRWYLMSRFVARHKGAVAAALMLFLTVAVAATVSLWQAQVAREQARIARAEARTTRAVQDFLESILRAGEGHQLDAIKARQRTADELIDAGVQRVSKALHDEPAAKERILRTLAEVMLSLGRPAEAAELRAQRAALIEQRAGPASAEAVMALAEWAYALVDASREDEAARVLTRAEQAWLNGEDKTNRANQVRSADKADPWGDVRLKLDLARAALRSVGVREGGLEPAQRAVAALLLKPPTPELFIAMDILATGQMQDGQLAAAGETVQQAIRLARAAPEISMAILPVLLDTLGDVQLRTGRDDEAEGHYREAVTLADRHAGPTSALAALARYNLALALGDLDRPLTGLPVMNEAVQIVRNWPARSPERDQYLPMYTLYLARLVRQAGRPAEALTHFDAARELVERASALPSFALYWRVERALTLIDLGRLGDAKREVDATRTLLSPMAAHGELATMVDIVALHHALALRRPDVAQELWLHTSQVKSESTGRRLTLLAARAEIDLLEGRCARSEQVAAQALAEFEARPPVRPRARAELTALVGRARLCLGQVSDARELLGAALRSWTEIEDANTSPRVAQVRKALAQAAGRSTGEQAAAASAASASMPR